ncbi:hypothetical protein ScalyP_jg2599 [Parmales sp. scaly parma]|nr:hypothetical protein ScalyP_jg2599 [Parmales sp. scaly parma]
MLLPCVSDRNDLPDSIRKIMDQCWNMRSDLRPTFKEVVERLEGECREEVVARTMLPNVNKSGRGVGGGLVSSRQDSEKLDLIKKELEVGAKRQQGEIEVERKKAQDRLRKRMVELQEEKKSGEIGLEDKEKIWELKALLLSSQNDRDLLQLEIVHLTAEIHKYKKE